MSALKDCPFCGSFADIERDEDGSGQFTLAAYCSNKECIARDVIGTVEQWNKRTPTPDATGKVLAGGSNGAWVIRFKP